jgi:glutaminase
MASLEQAPTRSQGLISLSEPLSQQCSCEDTLSTPRTLLSALESLEGEVTPRSVRNALDRNGILPSDPRIKPLIEYLDDSALDMSLDQTALWDRIEASSASLLIRMLDLRLAIPDFHSFQSGVKDIFNTVKLIRHGNVANYIPQLACAEPEMFGLSLCTVDGQRCSFGDSRSGFCVQSTSKPILYAMVLDRLGVDKVHKHVGREPSGHGFNELTLNPKNIPHNPMINAGAIMCASLLDSRMNAADRFNEVLRTYRDLACGERVGFDNAVFLSERDSADRNFALA